MIKILRNILQQFIDDIDSGNSNITESQQLEIIDMIQHLQDKELSKIEAAHYVGISRATFDNHIKKGWIPEGRKRSGFKELSWKKSDLDKYIQEHGK